MYNIITKVVNKYFSFLEEIDGLIEQPQNVPAGMQDNSKPPRFPDTQRWLATPSNVSDHQIDLYEKTFNVSLPPSYKHFLKLRNFVFLTLGEYEIVFFSNPSTGWLDSQRKQGEFFRKQIGARKLIPFAEYSDFGVICFDATNPVNANVELPIIWLDHEDGFEQEKHLANSLEELFSEYEPKVDEWILSVRESLTKGA